MFSNTPGTCHGRPYYNSAHTAGFATPLSIRSTPDVSPFTPDKLNSQNAPNRIASATPQVSPITPFYSARKVNGMETIPTTDQSLIAKAHPNSPNEVALEVAELNPPPPELPCWADLDTDTLPTSLYDRDWNAPKYHFRPAPRDPDKPTFSTWVDQDATATYDPNARFDPYLRPPTDCIPKQKRPRPERAFNYTEYKNKRPRIHTWQQGRLEGKRLVVTLDFPSVNSRSVLSLYGDTLDNWPGAAFTNEDGTPDWEAWWNSHEPVPESEFQFSDTYDLRDRLALGPASKDNSDDGDLHLEDLTLGHPAARGCKACFELGQPCPLVEEGSRYPCTLCSEDGLDCELIMEPLEKGRCTSCIGRRIVCPFAIDVTQRGPCQPCQDAGKKCIAGPKNGRTRTGPSLDSPYDTDEYVENVRAFVTCTQCRVSSFRVSPYISRPL